MVGSKQSALNGWSDCECTGLSLSRLRPLDHGDNYSVDFSASTQVVDSTILPNTACEAVALAALS